VPRFGISVDGNALASVVASLDRSTATVTLFHAVGDTSYSREVPISLRPIPDSLLDARYESLIRETGRSKNGRERVKALRSIPRPRFLPPLQDVAVSSAGTVLIDFESDTTVRDHLLIDSFGKPVAMIPLPSSTKVMQLDKDLIWAITRDSDGVPSVVRYRLELPGAG
jgi:hypothetical protein